MLEKKMEGWSTLKVMREELELGFASLFTLYKFLELLLKEIDKVVNIWIVALLFNFQTHQE